MKKITICFFAIFLCNTLYSYAQADLLEYFLARDGLSKAQSEASAQGISSPELTLVATMKKTITVTNPLNQQPADVTINFRLDDGKSNVWFYVFQSGTNKENKIILAVVKAPIISYYAQAFTEFPVELPMVSGELNKTLNDAAWLNSDKMAEKFRNESAITSFLGAHPNPETEFYGLSVNTVYEFVAKDIPIWSITVIDGEETKICGLNNSTEEVLCVDELGIDENAGLNENAELFPNPVESFFSINLPPELQGREVQTEIFDSYGRKVYSGIQFSETSANINFSAYPAGSYFVRVHSGDIHTGAMFIKQ